MTTIADIAQVVRSKNAGPFTLTLDVMFDDAAVYERFVASNVLTPEVMARLYQVPADRVEIRPFPDAKAVKVTMPRRVPSGEVGDTDVYATQQHVPLMRLSVPE